MTIAPFITQRSQRCFRIWPSNEQERNLDAGLIRSRGWQNIGIIYVEADYGKEGKEAFVGYMGNGFRFSFEESYKPGETNFRSIIAKIRLAEIDALIIIGYPPEFIPMVKQLRENKYFSPIIGDIGFTFEFVRKGLGKDADGIIFAVPGFMIGKINTVGEKFYNKYQSRYGAVPSWNECYSYDLILTISEALKISKRDDISSFSESLLKIGGLEGTSGSITIKNNRDAMTDLFLATIKEGKIIKYLN
jgi:branched-chain amino acid transport system substrate-binding protein